MLLSIGRVVLYSIQVVIVFDSIVQFLSVLLVFLESHLHLQVLPIVISFHSAAAPLYNYNLTY